jgi:acyl-[acyl-carrier-protein] desaturase
MSNLDVYLPSSQVAAQTPVGADRIGFRGLYRDFFDHAEAKRRWNLVDGIPWDQVKMRAVDEDLVEILEAFYSVEMYLPDYSAKLIALNRKNQGMAWFFTNWCYEEEKVQGVSDLLCKGGQQVGLTERTSRHGYRHEADDPRRGDRSAPRRIFPA